MAKQLDREVLLSVLSATIAAVSMVGISATLKGDLRAATRAEAICGALNHLHKSIKEGLFDVRDEETAPDTIPSPPPHDAASEESEHYERDAILYQSPPVGARIAGDLPNVQNLRKTEDEGPEPSFHGQFFD
jgi:hypothetical protein